MTKPTHDDDGAGPTAGHDDESTRREHSRRLHDLVNLVLAARLRVDAARVAAAAASRIENLDAVDACLDRIVEIARDLRGTTR